MQPPSKTSQPWDFDSHVYSSLLVELSKEEKPFYLVPGGQSDWDKVKRLYHKCPTKEGLVVANVEIIFNKEMLDGFLGRLKELEGRAGNTAFQANWMNAPDAPLRRKIHQELMALTVPIEGYKEVKLLPMFHGTTSALAPSILKTHFANLSTTDVGNFGKGLYDTSQAKYADLYARLSVVTSGQGEPRLFFNWVSFFSAFPVKDGDLPKLKAKSNVGNYDAHFALVAPKTARDDDLDCFPIKEGQAALYNELVVFQSNQILPRYLVTLGPSGMNIKRISVPHRAAELLEALLFFEKYPFGSLYLQASLNKLKVSLLTDPAALLSEEQNWILAHLICLNGPCEPHFKTRASHKLQNYFQAREPQGSVETKIVHAIRSFYEEQDFIPRLFGGVTSIESCYTELAIVDYEKKHNFVGAQQAQQTEPIASWEEINAAKEPIPLSDLFKGVSEGSDLKRILILGRAVIGKTTLCHHIAHRWASGKLWEKKFVAIFWIPLRKIAGQDLYSFILKNCFKQSQQTIYPSELASFIQENKEKILFLLDGYDEAPQNPLVQQLLDFPCWALTSRPYAVPQLRVDRTVENVGFNQAQVEQYVKRLLSEENGKALLKQLESDGWLMGLARVPLNLELICHLAQNQGASFAKTMTPLYRRFTLELQKRFLQKSGIIGASLLKENEFETLDPHYKILRDMLQEVAWSALEAKQLIFSFQNSKIYDAYRPDSLPERELFNQRLKEIGFLQATRSGTLFLEEAFCFAHLTFQEFFAAAHLVKLLHQNQKKAIELIQSQKFNPQFRDVKCQFRMLPCKASEGEMHEKRATFSSLEIFQEAIHDFFCML